MGKTKIRNWREYLVIPFDLAQFVLENRLTNPFRLYVYFHLTTSGRFELNKVIDQVCKDLEIKSKKTIHKNLNRLVELDWFGRKRKTDIYFLRSIEYLHQKCKHKRWATRIYINDLKHFRAFLAGSVISSLVNSMLRMRKPERLKKGLSLQGFRSHHGYWLVASKMIAEVLNISTSSALKYKILAQRYDYIHIQSNSKFVPGNLSMEFVNLYKEFHPEEANKVRMFEGRVGIQLPDLVRTNMLLVRRKKSNTYSKGYKGRD